MRNFVYAELMDSVTMEMLEDKLVAIISDNALFLVTTKENCQNYQEDFYPVDSEGRKAYGIEFKNGCLVSESYPSTEK